MIKIINGGFNVDDYDFVITPSYLENYYKEKYLNNDVFVVNIMNFILNCYDGNMSLAGRQDEYVVMFNTLRKVKDDLVYYKDYEVSWLVGELINTYDEFNEYDLVDGKKIDDLRLIYGCYEDELLSKNLMNYKMIFDYVLKHFVFDGNYLFVGFSRFNKRENLLLDKINENGSALVLIDNVFNNALYGDLRRLCPDLCFSYDEFLDGSYFVKGLNDISDEVSFISNDIAYKMFVNEDLSYDDFLIVSANVNDYLPYFDLFFNHPYSKRVNACLYVSRFLNVFLRILKGDFSCLTFVDLLKLNVLDVDQRLVDLTYNYVYHYNLKDDFYVSFTKSYYDRSVLDEINAFKEGVINPIRFLLENVINSNDKTEILRYLYTYLSEEGILDNLRKIDEKGYDSFISFLESVNDNLDDVVSFNEIIDVLGCFDFSSSYKRFMQDEVMVCGLNEALWEDKRYVYLIGADCIVGDFKVNGLLNTHDLTSSCLISNIRRTFDYGYYLFCKALSKNAIITYPKLGNDLRLKKPADFVSLIKSKTYDNDRIYDKNLLVNDYAIKLSNGKMNVYDEDVFSFINESFRHNLNYEVDSKLIRGVCGKLISLSPSKIETYCKCPFMFLVSYFLNVNGDERNLFDQRKIGSLVHFVLEKVIRNDALSVTEDNFDDYFYKYATLFLKQNEIDVTNTIKYVLKMVSSSVKEVVKNILNESKVSGFKPTYFEFKISDDSAIKPLVIKLNKASLKLSGIVDRMDVFEDNDGYFYRVIDYKTGNKNFRLDDVLDGINLQMLLYMLIIYSQSDKLSSKRVYPSAVLYYPASFKGKRISRGLSLGDKNKVISDALKMKGMVLNDERVFDVLGGDDASSFVSFKMRGKLNQEVLYRYEDLNNVFENIKKTLIRLGNDVISGRFYALPFRGRNNACSYCKYQAVCKFDTTSDPKQKEREMKNSEVLKLMEGDDYAKLD